MNKVALIGTYLKKIYRLYNAQLLFRLQQKGFTDLRGSFLEVLITICEQDGPTIKEVGKACGLKKQTMTSHLNELERRGYISRKMDPNDKRAQKVFLTEYGEKFKLNMLEALQDIENHYVNLVGQVEMDRIELLLREFFNRLEGAPLK